MCEALLWQAPSRILTSNFFDILHAFNLKLDTKYVYIYVV